MAMSLVRPLIIIGVVPLHQDVGAAKDGDLDARSWNPDPFCGGFSEQMRKPQRQRIPLKARRSRHRREAKHRRVAKFPRLNVRDVD